LARLTRRGATATYRRTPAPAERAPRRRFLHDNGLSLTLLALFLLCLVGQVLTGHRTFNDDELQHGRPTVSLGEYVSGSHFFEATAENWESEFLQMAAYIWLTAFLFQRGSAESNDPDAKHRRRHPADPRRAPWPVRRGGFVRKIYERSLSLTFALLFVVAFSLHAVSGAAHYNEQQLAHGGEALTTWGYLVTSQFWFESFQNWQSEFLAILSMIVLSIFLRQKDSPESKEVERPHAETGG
jgi:hypothetical protein